MDNDQHHLGMHNAAQSLDLAPDVLQELRAALPDLAKSAVHAITEQVPSYHSTFTGDMGRSIQSAVELALVNFLRLAAKSTVVDPTTPIAQSTAAAYELGRGEARSGRTMEALLAAYRIGARVCWRELSAVADNVGISAHVMGRFAELVFAYIDALSSASITGHADELATTGRVKARYLERLGVKIAQGATEAILIEAAQRAAWTPPSHLVAIWAHEAQVTHILPQLSGETLIVPTESLGLKEPYVVHFTGCPDVSSRNQLRHRLRHLAAIVGPRREWTHGTQSYHRTHLTWASGIWDGTSLTDTEENLPALIQASAPECVTDLTYHIHEPLVHLTDAQRTKLIATLHAWVQCQGHRDRMAALLFVHPQTVRYRVQQLTGIYGDTLHSHEFLTKVAMTIPPTTN